MPGRPRGRPAGGHCWHLCPETRYPKEEHECISQSPNTRDLCIVGTRLFNWEIKEEISKRKLDLKGCRQSCTEAGWFLYPPSPALALPGCHADLRWLWSFGTGCVDSWEAHAHFSACKKQSHVVPRDQLSGAKAWCDWVCMWGGGGSWCLLFPFYPPPSFLPHSALFSRKTQQPKIASALTLNFLNINQLPPHLHPPGWGISITIIPGTLLWHRWSHRYFLTGPTPSLS